MNGLECGCHSLSKGSAVLVLVCSFVSKCCEVIGQRSNGTRSKGDLPRPALSHPQTRNQPLVLLCSGLGP